LQNQQADHEAEKTHQQRTAGFEAGEVGIEADGREEGKHQRCLHGGIEAHFNVARGAQDQ
jgi:hypothetical protein